MSPDVHTLTGAYALDALDELERRRFEAHLAECPDCTQEVDELRATAAKLGVAAAETPPERLRQRVMAQVATTRQEPPAPDAATAATRRRAARRTGWAARLTAAAAGLAAAAAVVLGVVTVRAGAERDAAQTQLAQLEARYAPLAQLASAPDARGDSGTGAHGGTAFVLASHTRDRAVLLVDGLPAPPAGHTYQAWLIGGGQARSAGLVPSDPGSGAPPLEFTGLAGASKVGLTVEPAGGSAQPTTTPVVLFDLPA
ncbi:MAG TPA: anti-sigma factor [Pseudonocardia sp.]|jgi:anti-sigma factor RsiW|nr:anti-sigma factor [Pseudonocardia sp.]